MESHVTKRIQDEGAMQIAIWPESVLCKKNIKRKTKNYAGNIWKNPLEKEQHAEERGAYLE